MPTKISDGQLKRFQENLPTFRKIIGYSAEELGELIGLTRQSVTNLETGKTPFTPLHHRAIFHLINEVYIEKIVNDSNEINPNTLILPIAMKLLIEVEDFEDADYDKCKKIFTQLSTLMSDGVVDDPVATLRGLILSTYELNAGDVIPIDSLIGIISETISTAVMEMTNEIGRAIDELPED